MCLHKMQFKIMDKRKILSISATILASGIVVGCSNIEIKETIKSHKIENNLELINFEPFVKFEHEENKDSDGFSYIKNYKLLKSLNIEDTIKNIKYITLPTARDVSDYTYNTIESIKSLLGENLDILPYQSDLEFSNLYVVKGYEKIFDEFEKEQKYIVLNPEGKTNEVTGYLNNEKISFVSTSTLLEDSLKKILSMEDKIKVMLNNLMGKEEAEEVLKFIKEEISRINIYKEKESAFNIVIDKDTYLEYLCVYDNKNNVYYNKLSLCNNK